MRFIKWLSVLTILALLCTMLPAVVAEDEMTVELEGFPVEGFGTDEDDLEGIDVLGDLSLSFEDDGLELDGLENSLINPEISDQLETPLSSNENGNFVIDEEGVLTRYRGFDKNVVIPDGVKEIGANAFINDSIMESISIPSSVTYIGFRAFYECTGLKSIVIPDNVTKMDSLVMAGCTSLTSVQLSNSLTDLPSETFSDCSSLEAITLPNGIISIEGYAFYRCNKLKDITLPNNLVDIGEKAFAGCNSLESITIPASVSIIDRAAFDDCDNVVIRGMAGSYAERFAEGVGIPFNAPIVTFDEEIINEHMSIEGNYQYFEGLIHYVNQSRTLNAVQKPADLARALAWSSSSPNIVIVDQNGTIRGVSQGRAIITVNTADGKGRAAQIEIVVPGPTEIKLGDDREIVLGQTKEIIAETSIPYQYKTNVEMPVTWSTSDNSVTSIETTEDNKATLKGCKLGKATITATTPDGGIASIEIEVVRPAVESVKIDQSGPITLHPDEQCRLTATLSPEYSASPLNWSSGNTEVATVNSDGVVTAVAEGSAEIYVTTDNYCQSSIGITVAPLHPHPESIKIDQTNPITLYPGQKCTLTTTLTPADAEAKRTWYTNNVDVATVSQKGVIKAVAAGRTEIIVETDNGCADSIEVNVLVPPQKITLNKTKATLAVGNTLTLKTTIVPEDAETGLKWSSSAPEVAKVSTKGKVTALKVGKATITVRTDNGKTAKAMITVKPAPKKVKLNKSKATLGVNKKLTLKASLTPSDAYTTLTWTSSNKKVATVNGKGVVTGKKPGTAVITVRTKNGKTAKATITVK